ncbi:hypothetical protein [Roseicitreum antarcticum]|uniref:hypothetical protein n=1 Tax=Roseicitreum antarcticum TaxID=564137 RepID=UPI00115FA0B2|nr:hypothetical protein [Roseicitreum antarcticum]
MNLSWIFLAKIGLAQALPCSCRLKRSIAPDRKFAAIQGMIICDDDGTDVDKLSINLYVFYGDQMAIGPVAIQGAGCFLAAWISFRGNFGCMAMLI